jgi:hypothetical protein
VVVVVVVVVVVQRLDNQNELRVFFLSQISNNVRRRPLCRLLKLYDIQHDAKSSTTVLRRSFLVPTVCTTKAVGSAAGSLVRYVVMQVVTSHIL